MNDDEMLTMTEWFGFSEDLRDGIIDLATKFSCKAVCITRGSQGSVLYLNQKYAEHRGFKVKIKDTVGSGDAFLAALIHGIINDMKNYEILEYANSVGAYVATKNGATPKLHSEKINKILNHKD